MPERPAHAGSTSDLRGVRTAPTDRLPGGVTIRLARKSDAAPIGRLTARLFAAYGSYEHYLLDWMRREDVRAPIAISGSQFCGYGMLRLHEEPTKSAELIAIAVDPSVQSRGVGSLLLEWCTSMARSHIGPSTRGELWLSVAEGNARGQRFFASRGFRLTGEVGVYPAGQRALSMAKTLDPKTSSKGDTA